MQITCPGTVSDLDEGLSQELRLTETNSPTTNREEPEEPETISGMVPAVRVERTRP